jgi:hypothetical protein
VEKAVTPEAAVIERTRLQNNPVRFAREDERFKFFSRASFDNADAAEPTRLDARHFEKGGNGAKRGKKRKGQFLPAFFFALCPLCHFAPIPLCQITG